MAGKKGSAARELRQPWRKGPRLERHSAVDRARATFHLPSELLNEMRNAVVALSGPPEQLTMSKVAEIAIRRELKRLRDHRSGTDRGKPFTERSSRVRRGRPLV